MPDERADEPHDPALTTGALLVVGVLAVSCSGPLAASLAAPALAVAMWRNAFGAAVVVPFAAARRRAEPGARLAARAAGARAGPARRGRARRALRPVDPEPATHQHHGLDRPGHHLAALHHARRPAGRSRRAAGCAGRRAHRPRRCRRDHRAGRRQQRPRAGRRPAGAGRGAAAAVYTLLGADVRRSMSTAGYTSIAYTTCALVLLPVCLVGGVRLAGWSGSTWLGLAALTASAQLLGHSLFNRVLRSLGATTVALVILLEVPGATLVAWAFLDQAPPLRTLPGAVLVLLGLVLVVRAGARARRRSRQVEVVDGTPW
nr:DMT family transporter [Angustibacter aerolatus]